MWTDANLRRAMPFRVTSRCAAALRFRRRNPRTWPAWSLLLGAAALSAGCESLGGAFRPGDERDNVVMIVQYYRADPWVRDEDGRINGVLVRVYFAAAAKENDVPKGIFVPGTIKAALYALILRPDGGYERTLAHEWTFDEQQAAGFRIPRPSKMGYSYGLVLRWPPEVNVAGREIQVQFSYQKKDGKLIAQSGSRFRVPLPAGVLEPRRPAWSEPGAERGAPATRPHTAPGAE